MGKRKVVLLMLFTGITGFATVLATAPPARAAQLLPPDTCAHSYCDGVMTYCHYSYGCVCFMKQGICDGSDGCAVE